MRICTYVQVRFTLTSRQPSSKGKGIRFTTSSQCWAYYSSDRYCCLASRATITTILGDGQGTNCRIERCYCNCNLPNLSSARPQSQPHIFRKARANKENTSVEAIVIFVPCCFRAFGRFGVNANQSIGWTILAYFVERWKRKNSTLTFSSASLPLYDNNLRLFHCSAVASCFWTKP